MKSDLSTIVSTLTVKRIISVQGAVQGTASSGVQGRSPWWGLGGAKSPENFGQKCSNFGVLRHNPGIKRTKVKLLNSQNLTEN